MSNVNKPGPLVAIVIYCVLNSLATLAGSFLLGLASQVPILSTGGSIALVIVSMTSLGFGIALLAASYGLWTLQKWGWQLSIAALSASIVLGVIAILPILPDSSFSIGNLIYQLLFIAINALSINYLLRYEVKKLLHVFPYL